MKKYDKNTPILTWDRSKLETGFLDEDWALLTDSLTTVLDEINPDGLWYVEVENFGWRNLSGLKIFKSSHGRHFLSEILPECECTFKIFRDGNTLTIENYHHDSPTGEWYTITQYESQPEAA